MGCAIEVHRQLGPGLLESTYQQCLAHEMHIAGLSFKAQLLTYMKLAEAPLGLILNFNVELLKDGIRKCTISNFSALSCVNFKKNHHQNWKER
ncbi:GxxExxY protein [Oligoflexia bacterium]|nr:GxxExxY protein [Oligoflexia bacterium]